MSKANVTPSEFCDLVVCFLLDKILHPDEVVFKNKEFDKLSTQMTGKGLKPIFLQYYLDTNSSIRIRYKRIRKTLTDGNTGSIINIGTDGKKEVEEPVKKKESLLKKVIKKLLKKEDLSIEEEETVKELLLEIKEVN